MRIKELSFGGGFTIGAASQYDGSYLVARSVARVCIRFLNFRGYGTITDQSMNALKGTPVIYISHNYRLGLLGLPQGQEGIDDF